MSSEVERFDHGKELGRQSGIYLRPPASRVVLSLKIILIFVAWALGLFLLLLYWLSGGVDGDFGTFGVMLLDILGA